MPNLGRSRQYGKQLGGGNYLILGTWSINFFRDINISMDIVSVLDMDIRVWLAQMCAKFEKIRQELTILEKWAWPKMFNLQRLESALHQCQVLETFWCKLEVSMMIG
jgi:hypothetical protein